MATAAKNKKRKLSDAKGAAKKKQRVNIDDKLQAIKDELKMTSMKVINSLDATNAKKLSIQELKMLAKPQGIKVSKKGKKKLIKELLELKSQNKNDTEQKDTEENENKNTLNSVNENKQDISCKKCKKENEDGRICDKCDIFVCQHYIDQCQNFCSGLCEQFFCKECVQKHGKLRNCPRKECECMVCVKCTYKCENCWDMMAIHGVDDEDIETALRSGNYEDYFDDDW
eukprot:178226_1